MPSSWVHLAIGLAFFSGMFLIDIDHLGNNCSFFQQTCRINDYSKLFLHRWLTVLIPLAFAFGAAWHLLMDSTINGAYPL